MTLVLFQGNASVVVYLTGLVDTSLPASADFPCCVSHQQTKQQLGDTIQTDVPLSCHFSYSEDLHVLMFLFFPFPPLPSSPFFSSVPPQKSVKEGILLKQTSSFQRWKRRYFKLRGRTLYYAKDCKVPECVRRPRAALMSPQTVVFF